MILKRQDIESGNSGSLFIILFLEGEMLLEKGKKEGRGKEGEREREKQKAGYYLVTRVNS